MTKAEEIYHRFVQYEWNEIGEGMKKSILDAINEALRQPPVSGRSELLIALQNIEKICDNQNPTHEQIWRIAYEAINSH